MVSAEPLSRTPGTARVASWHPFRARPAALLRLDSTWVAAGWYCVLTLLLTWPVVTSLHSRVPLDLDDPLLNCWILAWNGEHLLGVLRGDWTSLSSYWNANIFYPEPSALAYSEHLFAQALQILPVYGMSGNVVLGYNLVFLSTFALSGVGMFLLVRQLTGNARAAFLSGLVYAFTPYRLAQLGHLQVLSSQWMPFALYGLRRFFDARTPGARFASGVRPLVIGVVAVIAQNLSCGYYLVYFAPFLAAFVVWEVIRRGLWREWRVWTLVGAAGAAVTAATLPFLIPYLRLRSAGFGPRPLSEVTLFSADVYSYLIVSPAIWAWRWLTVDIVRTEAVLFPGAVPVLLAGVASVGPLLALRRRTLGEPPLRGWRLAVAAPVAGVGLAAGVLAAYELFAGNRIWRIRDVSPELALVTNVLAVAAAAAALLLVLSARARAAVRPVLASSRAFFATALAAAVWLSFGPFVRTHGFGISGETAYAWLYRWVPGFDGLRVPARFGMLVMLFLAVLAGYGAAAIDRGARAREGVVDRPGRGWRGRWWLAVVAVVWLVESAGLPLPVKDVAWPRRDTVTTGVVSASDLAPLYRYLAKLPHGTVIVEFPFGDLHGETRAVFLSTRHWHPILNGYSGGFPAHYRRLVPLLADPLAAGDDAWRALVASGATCIVVHEWDFGAGTGQHLSRWLEARGARPVTAFKSDRVFELRRGAAVPTWGRASALPGS